MGHWNNEDRSGWGGGGVVVARLAGSFKSEAQVNEKGQNALKARVVDA